MKEISQDRIPRRHLTRSGRPTNRAPAKRCITTRKCVPTSPNSVGSARSVLGGALSVDFDTHSTRARRIHLHHGQGNERPSRWCRARFISAPVLYRVPRSRQRRGRSRRSIRAKVPALAREAVTKAWLAIFRADIRRDPGNRPGGVPVWSMLILPSSRPGPSVCAVAARSVLDVSHPGFAQHGSW